MRLVIWLSVCLLTACGGGGGGSPTLASQPQPTTPTPEPISVPVPGQNIVSQTIRGQLVDRTFLIRAPEEQTNNSYPVVFFFHGAGGSGEAVLSNNPDISDLIDAGQFIGIFPDGYEQRWNVSGETNADDVAFVSLIINSLDADSSFNLDRVYGVGISNGAGLVNKIAKEASVFSGIAPLISQQTVATGETVPSQALSVFQVNGTDDELVPFKRRYWCC